METSHANSPARARRRLDVLRQLRALMRLAPTPSAATHSDPLLRVLDAMTPEQLRKVHDGLAVLVDCMGGLDGTRPQP